MLRVRGVAGVGDRHLPHQLGRLLGWRGRARLLLGPDAEVSGQSFERRRDDVGLVAAGGGELQVLGRRPL